jgi:hypothetical protein
VQHVTFAAVHCSDVGSPLDLRLWRSRYFVENFYVRMRTKTERSRQVGVSKKFKPSTIPKICLYSLWSQISAHNYSGSGIKLNQSGDLYTVKIWIPDMLVASFWMLFENTNWMAIQFLNHFGVSKHSSDHSKFNLVFERPQA